MRSGAESGRDDLALSPDLESELERRYIEKALQVEYGRVEEMARKLGLSRGALYEKIRKHGVNLSRIHKQSPEFRTASP